MPAADDGIMAKIIELCVSATAGALVTLVAFRTRLALMDKRMDGSETKADERHEAITRRLDTIDRRQIVTLQIMADVASKLQIDGRFTDMLVKFLAEERESQ